MYQPSSFSRKQHWCRCVLTIILAISTSTFAFAPTNTITKAALPQSSSSSGLAVSIGLGPEKENNQGNQQQLTNDDNEDEWGHLEIPNHEEYRTSRRSALDEECDQWYEHLLNDTPDTSVLGNQIVTSTRNVLETPVPLVNDYEKDSSDPEWTPYVQTRLPWTPLVPAFGLEQFGLPIPRRNAETWRHFDVGGLVRQDYSRAAQSVVNAGDESATSLCREQLQQSGVWLNDDACFGRLVYINGYYCAALSKTVQGQVTNLDDCSSMEALHPYLSRLTDGFTDELAAPVPNGERTETLLSKLSTPNHNMGNATSQFAINTQQGTACFAALNNLKARGVAYVHNTAQDVIEQPVVIINAVTSCGGVESAQDDKGVSMHPRTLILAEAYSRLSVVQACVDLDLSIEDGDDSGSSSRSTPKLYNGYTQVFVQEGANVSHSYVDESGGMVTAGVELSDSELEPDEPVARLVEADRPALRDSHLEAIDVHVMGDGASYEGTLLSVGGSGRIRIAHSLSLLKPKTVGILNGFSLSGGTQRTDVKTNIHHVASGTESHQLQKNMVGGRSTSSFRGRIRVEQSAQQTDSTQLSRTVLLSDKARSWAVPSLEIIADDVQCTHGATISDLSEEELFYLRSRGLDRALARNLLMYAFAGDICACVDPALLGRVDSSQGLQKRLIRKLENLVPRGDRVISGDFQSI